MYYQKIYRCRKTVWVEKYQRRVYAKGEKRSERKAPTPEQKKKENDLQAKRLLARKLEANFGEDDYFVTLTYKGDAPNQEEAKRRLDKFIRGMREDYRKLGSELKYIVVTEWQGKRIHHHIVMNGLPETPKLLKKHWPHGRPDMKLLDESGDYEALAEYLIKETEKTFRDSESARKQRYTCSRNLLNPEPERKKIKAKSFRQTPKPPKGYKIVEGTLVSGVSEVSGYLYQYYKLITTDSMEDTLNGLKNVVTQALIENSKLRIPVHNPDKHLIECYGQIIKEAARGSYRLPDVLVEAADLPAPITYIGDLPEKKIYKIIANYYGGEAK